jgi:hypothetical protein
MEVWNKARRCGWVLGITLLDLTYRVLLVLAVGWLTMILVGDIHHDWIHQCPTLSYPDSVLIGALTLVLFTLFSIAQEWRIERWTGWDL